MFIIDKVMMCVSLSAIYSSISLDYLQSNIIFKAKKEVKESWGDKLQVNWEA